MSMSMPMSNDTGAGPSVVDLPLSDPNCVSAGDACIAYYQAHNASQAATPWAAQFHYGHYIMWYYLVAILLVILARLFLLARQHHAKCESSKIPNLTDKYLAIVRSIAYPRKPKWLSQYIQLPPAGVSFFLAITVLYALLLTFIAHPYLRPHRGYGSPPLAVRTGLMAIALTPLIFATVGKVNPITILTGVSYEKLNIYHRWISWICFGLAVVHTGPFIAAPLIDGGYEALHTQWNKAGSFEFTGTPPMFVLSFLVVCSLPWIRRRFYETFVSTHIMAAIAYFGLMFWHAGQEGDSWVYLWASLAIWMFGLFGRAITKQRILTQFRSALFGYSSTLTSLSDGMVRLDVTVPATLKWKAGQHFFLRFPKLLPWQCHPFTVGNVPQAINGNSSLMTFYIRSQSGLTSKLSLLADEKSTCNINTWVDGPYGESFDDSESIYDTFIFMVGGSGISTCLSRLQELSKTHKDGYTPRVHIIWAIRHRCHIKWVGTELSELSSRFPHGSLNVRIYVTAEQSSKLDVENCHYTIEDEKVPDVGEVNIGRPELGRILPQLASNLRTRVFACGPPSLQSDVSNAVAAAQGLIVSGKAKEISLHLDSFDW